MSENSGEGALADWTIPEDEWAAFIAGARRARAARFRKYLLLFSGLSAAFYAFLSLTLDLDSAGRWVAGITPAAGFGLALLIVRIGDLLRLRRFRSTRTGRVLVYPWGAEVNDVRCVWHYGGLIEFEKITLQELPPLLIARAYRRSSKAPAWIRAEVPVPLERLEEARALIRVIETHCRRD